MFEVADAPMPRPNAFADLAVVGTEPSNVITTRFNRHHQLARLRLLGLKSRLLQGLRDTCGQKRSQDPSAMGSLEKADATGESSRPAA